MGVCVLGCVRDTPTPLRGLTHTLPTYATEGASALLCLGCFPTGNTCTLRPYLLVSGLYLLDLMGIKPALMRGELIEPKTQ